jgi:DNA-directed RNA polymerase specialized sigma24 family protein
MTTSRKCLDDVFVHHYHELVAYSRRRVDRRMGDPEDFVHLAYLKCRRRWSPTRRSQYSEVAYLYRALRWVIIDAIRQHSRRAEMVTLLASPDVATEPPVQLARLVTREAWDRLRGRERAVCESALQGHRAEQTCGELRINGKALAVYLCRAKAALTAALR